MGGADSNVQLSGTYAALRKNHGMAILAIFSKRGNINDEAFDKQHRDDQKPLHF